MSVGDQESHGKEKWCMCIQKDRIVENHIKPKTLIIGSPSF